MRSTPRQSTAAAQVETVQELQVVFGLGQLMYSQVGPQFGGRPQQRAAALAEDTTVQVLGT